MVVMYAYCSLSIKLLPISSAEDIIQAMHGAPLYIAETSPSKIRGTLVSLKELFIVLGILVPFLSENMYQYNMIVFLGIHS